ncbi:ClpXP protease specificity-enhancing factor SspB, partial [Aeromonas hydrophila]
SQQVYIPMAAVLAIHARENGVGTLFPPEPGYDLWLEQAQTPTPVDPEPEPPRPSGRPTLKVIK